MLETRRGISPLKIHLNLAKLRSTFCFLLRADWDFLFFKLETTCQIIFLPPFALKLSTSVKGIAASYRCIVRQICWIDHPTHNVKSISGFSENPSCKQPSVPQLPEASENSNCSPGTTVYQLPFATWNAELGWSHNIPTIGMLCSQSHGMIQPKRIHCEPSWLSRLLVWGSISFIHIRFHSAWAKQGRTTRQLLFKSFSYPGNAYFFSLLSGGERFRGVSSRLDDFEPIQR